MGNIVRRVLHVIREENLSLATVAIAGLGLSAASDDEDDEKRDDRPVLSPVAVAANARSTLRTPSLQTLLEDIPYSPAVPPTPSSGGDSEGKSRLRNIDARQSSKTVLDFLCAAKEKKRSLRYLLLKVLQDIRDMSLQKNWLLEAYRVQTTVITDSAVFAIISRVNMVIVGAHAVMANGGVITPVGLNIWLHLQLKGMQFLLLYLVEVTM